MIQRFMRGLIPFAILMIAIPLMGLELGDKPPKQDVEMKNIDGDMVSIEGIQGDKGTLVLFICNHCPWVKAWESRIAEIGNTYQEKGIGVIGVNSNDPEAYPSDDFEAMQKRAEKVGYQFPYVVDATSEVARAFGATKTPEAFLFNADGELVYHGTIDDNARKPDKVEKEYLKNALEAVVNGKEVPTKNTKALGCSIKYRDA